MPRGNFAEANKGGVGFVEGYVIITRSVAKVFQYPMNSQTNEQSDPFPALVWEGFKLTPEWKLVDGDDNTFEIVNRMGALDQIRPGKLDPKDFDNLEKEPDDLGVEVGTEGNSFYFEAGAKFGASWAHMKESLEKHAFKPSILGRCVATDFEGMVAHFKTVEGEKYIAKKGKNAGKEVKPTNLVCDRIQTFPYDVKDKKAQLKTLGITGEKGKKDDAGKTTAPGANGSADTAGAGAGAAGGSGAGAAEPTEIMAEVGSLFQGFSDKFKAEIAPGTAVKRAAFQKALTMELLRKKIAPATQKQIMEFVKGDQFAVLGETTELFKVEGDTITIAA